ncbi:MAG: dihydrolipoamide acetyltransferase family protein [Chloroflexi bacterium]|nr:dihydrolipoamide acetyltransferase family protein [Chloroflexota bacterium]
MATPIVMPKLGMVMAEGIVAKWRKNHGDEVKQGEVIADIETEKISYELEATESGKLHTLAKDGDTVEVYGLVGYLLAEGEEVPAAPPSKSSASAPGGSSTPARPQRQAAARIERQPGADVPSTPGARKLAAKLAVDLSKVEGTGPRGRVVEVDVQGFKDKGGASSAPAAPAAPAGPPPGLPEPSKTVPMGGMRKGIAEHMRSSIQTTAQLTFTLEVDITDMARKRKEATRSSGTTLTNPHVLIKACAIALQKVPQLNTILAGGKILHFDQINMGVAVALPEGLIVPVIKGIQDMSVFDIAKTAHDLTSRAKDGKITPDEVTGGTFTISVIPTVDTFTPILNRGQSAILGVGGAKNKPAVVNGEIVAREFVTLNLTVDHQTVDGAVAASFMKALQDAIEKPDALFE